MMHENLIKLYETSFRENWDLPAVSDYTTKHTITYGQLAQDIARIHLFYKKCDVKSGDKIALLGKNNLNWVTVFLATITYGATIVPILSEFSALDASHIINHSDSKLLFVGTRIFETLDFDSLKNIKAAISIDDMKLLAEKSTSNVDAALRGLTKRFNAAYPDGYGIKQVSYPKVPNDKVLIINYTSGTTGFSKGVMLTGNNLAGNVVFGMKSKLHWRNSRSLSFLPLAHAYGCAFDLLTPLVVGTHVTLLGRIPSPNVIVKAMNEVKPDLVISVPLVLEKIYRKQIQPMLKKGVMKVALNVPLLDKKIYAKIREKLVAAFGGNFSQIICGGAPMNAEVERFLKKIKFPYTVGYGMTECGPLISYTYWTDYVMYSAGKPLPGIMKARIDSPNPQTVPGEICVKGENVMKGYYKNPEATKAVLDKDGWLHTGDMGTMSADGTIFIRGRYKTMILSSNGQNIYPEEIEAKLNNMPYVSESLVIDRDGKLVALVYPDYERADAEDVTNEQLPVVMEQIRKELNKIVAPYEQISKIQLMPNEFEKTPKQSIKRYLYNN